MRQTLPLARLHRREAAQPPPAKPQIPGGSNYYPCFPTLFSSTLSLIIHPLCHQISPPPILTQPSYTSSCLHIKSDEFPTLLQLCSGLDPVSRWIASSSKGGEAGGWLSFFLLRAVWSLTKFLPYFWKLHQMHNHGKVSLSLLTRYCESAEGV